MASRFVVYNELYLSKQRFEGLLNFYTALGRRSAPQLWDRLDRPHCSIFINFVDLFSVSRVFSCPQQLNRWPWHFFTFFLHFLTILTILKIWSILTIWQFQQFRQTWQFRQFLIIFYNVDHFGNFWHLWTFFDNFLKFFENFEDFENFENFENFDNLTVSTIKTNLTSRTIFWQLKWQSWRLVTFETLITVVTIENLNSWQSLLTDNYLWHWMDSIRNSCDVSKSWLFVQIWFPFFPVMKLTKENRRVEEMLLHLIKQHLRRM